MLFFDLFRHDPNVAEFPAGQTLCQEGEVSDVMYVLLSGNAEIRSGNLLLERVGVGDIVGELGVLDAVPRIATVTALTDCVAAVIDQKRFQFLVEGNPHFALEVMQVMARRLRQCDVRLREHIAN
jgi:CRP/FNR family transcriptional regulator, cyclic AMP receptor protein